MFGRLSVRYRLHVGKVSVTFRLNQGSIEYLFIMAGDVPETYRQSVGRSRLYHKLPKCPCSETSDKCRQGIGNLKYLLVFGKVSLRASHKVVFKG